MSARSQNQWPALERGTTKLHTWVIPAKSGTSACPLRNGSAGFILAHLALWLAETVAPLAGKITDDWGYAYRPVRGYETTLSNHSSGTAMDLNATAHPLGKVGTWPSKQATKIRNKLAWRSTASDPLGRRLPRPQGRDALRDRRAARRLREDRAPADEHPARSSLLQANPGQRAVIES
jgi:hypothetical protein